MKLPRWLIVSMLTASALAVLGAAGWWWVTWPERTARLFVHLMASNRVQDADAMSNVDITFFVWASTTTEGLNWSEAILEPKPCTVVDFLFARRRFKISKLSCTGLHIEELSVAAGSIVDVAAWGGNPMDIIGFMPKNALR